MILHLLFVCGVLGPGPALSQDSPPSVTITQNQLLDHVAEVLEISQSLREEALIIHYVIVQAYAKLMMEEIINPRRSQTQSVTTGIRNTLGSVVEKIDNLEVLVRDIETKLETMDEITEAVDEKDHKSEDDEPEEEDESEEDNEPEEDERQEDDEPDDLNCGTWRLAMNLNPTDGHIMSYTTGWSGRSSIGNYREELQKDYVDKQVWHLPAKYIAIARHQNNRTIEAVKVFRFNYTQRYSLAEMFNSSNPDFYRQVVAVEVQKDISTSATVRYDPIFSVGGDLAFNWGFYNNGVRMVLTGGYLEVDDGTLNSNTHATRGLGAHYFCDPVSGTSEYSDRSSMEIGSMFSVGFTPYAIGTDHGEYFSSYTILSDYGQYAIYVSEDADTFPGPGSQLQLEVEGLC